MITVVVEPNNTEQVETANQRDDWRTPDWLFKALDLEFNFDVDGAADASNCKCDLFVSNIETDKILVGARVFCNPPYSYISPFVDRALEGAAAIWVFILPVRTRTRWFERLRLAEAEFRWLRRRIAFDPPPGVEPSSPRMDTFIAIVRPRV